MSKPGSSSSRPASISATTSEKKPSTDSKDSKAPRPRGFVHALWDTVRSPPPWVTNNIRQRRSQQLLFRSCLASWAALILMLPNRVLQTYGNLGYFGILFSMLVPPGYPVQIYIVLIFQSLLGLLTGWGIGSAAMKAAIAVRSELVDEATLQKVSSSFQGSVNPEQLYKVAVFQGDFLNASASVMFGVFLGFGALMFSLVRAYCAPFFFFSIFGTISLDILCAIGPLYPFPNYKIINSLLLSASSYCAIALLCCFVLFPQTVNHVYLGVISTILDKVKAMLTMQESLLSPQPGDFTPGCPKLEAMMGIRAAVAGMYQTLSGLKVHLQSEFSVGRWNGDDASGIADPLLAVLSRINGLLSFSKHLCDLPSPPEAFSYVPAPTSVSTDTHLLHHVFSPDRTSESALNLTLTEVLPRVRDATAELRTATLDGVTAVKELVTAVNNARLFSHSVPLPPLEERLDAASDELRKALSNFKERGADGVLGAYGQTPSSKPLRSLYLGYVFCSTTVIIGEVVLSLVQTVAETSARCKRVRLWGPSSLRHVAKELFKGRRRNEEQTFGEEQKNYLDDEDDILEAEGEYHLDPDSHPPTNIFQKFMSLIHFFLRWTKTAEALFVFRYVLISILLWLPAVFPHSAHFYYVNKGIWALIMAQTILTVYAGDQIFNFAIRMVGTLLGLTAAVLIWYTGNGSGNGNPYGLAASYGVLIFPVMFVRLFAPPQYLPGAILGTATVALIIGYSWIDGHLPVISNPGIGGNAAWRRWTLIVIGCAATFIIMMLPPKSGRKAVRLRAAASIDSLGHAYTTLMSAWVMESDTGKEHSFTSSNWVQPFRRRLIAVTSQIQAGKQHLMLASWEGSIRGRWPKEEYVKLTEVQEEMIAVLSQLGGALWKLDTKRRISLLHHTRVVDPNFISDVVSVFTSVSQSLRTSTPVHSVLPETLLDRLLLHHQYGEAATPDGHGEIGPDEMQSLDHMFYASAVIAVYQLILCLDELHATTRRLCGGVHIPGFDKWILQHKSKRGIAQSTAVPQIDTARKREPFVAVSEKTGEVV